MMIMIIWSSIAARPLSLLLLLLISLLHAPHVKPESPSDSPTSAVAAGESIAAAPTSSSSNSRPPGQQKATAANGPARAALPAKPPGMSDAEYKRLINLMRTRQMNEPERDDFWKNV